MVTPNQPSDPSTSMQVIQNAAAVGRAGALTGRAVAASGLVYMGADYMDPQTFADPGKAATPRQLSAARRSTGATVSQWTVDRATAYAQAMSPQEKAMLFDYTTSLSGHTKHNEYTRLSAWNDAITKAQQQTYYTGRPVSPWDIMNAGINEYIALGGGSQGGGGGAGGGPTSTLSTVLTNEMDAEVLVNNALNQYLGREATGDEIQEFYKQLNKVERQNPTLTTNTGGPNSQTEQSGGMNRELVARDYALSRDDAAEYMANTQYTDWLMEAIMADPTKGIASGL